MRLAVHIQDTLAGHIVVAGHHDAIEYRPTESYATAYPREVLGQVFEDQPEAVHRSRVRLPPFFSNLLPEGLLRELV
ncbi:HipA N-terminal domain-containing protein, partial [Salmonella enterica]|uniref:HipA N-terminal domain-containing protein n=1 Tax=Salmonella enterica TaxID=28901 RepID=UPI001653F939